MSSRSIVTEQRSVTTLISEHAVQQFTEQQIEEKEEMRTLNNRLSTHIDHVRGLEEENIRLRKILDSLKSQWGKILTNTKYTKIFSKRYFSR